MRIFMCGSKCKCQNYVGLNNLVFHPKTVSLVFVIRKLGYTNLFWGRYWDHIGL